MNTFELMGQERNKMFIYLLVSIIINIFTIQIVIHPLLIVLLSNALMIFAIPIILGHFIYLIYEKTESKNYIFWIRKIFFSYLFIYLLTFIFYMIVFKFLQSSGVLGTFNREQFNSRMLFYFYGAVLNSFRFIILFYLIVYKVIYGRNIFASIPSSFRNLYFYNLSSDLIKLILVYAILLFINAFLIETGVIGQYVSAIFFPIIFAYGIIAIISILKNAGLECSIDIN